MSRTTFKIKSSISGATASLLLATAAFAQVYPAVTGDVSGYIQDALGQPIAGAVVTTTQTFSATATTSAAASAQPATITEPVTLSKISQPDGAFFFTNLPPGSYKLCGQLLGSTLLNPCQWSPNPPMVNVTAGQIISNGLIPMQTGVLVLVRLDSPDAVLAAQPKGKPENQVLAVLRAAEGWSRGEFRTPATARYADSIRQLEPARRSVVPK